MLHGTKFIGGGTDRAYADLDVAFDIDNSLDMVSAVAINEHQVVVTFSRPVSIGDKGKNPFMSIRYIDKNGNLIWDGEIDKSNAMQFQGNWEYCNDDHSQIIWTMNEGNTYGANNITEVLNFAGGLDLYKSARIMFSIEEIPENAVDNQGYNNLVCNVRSTDGVYELTATKCSGRDGAYADLAVEYDAVLVIDDITGDGNGEVEYRTIPYDYIWLYITSGGILLTGLASTFILIFGKRKSDDDKEEQ